MFGKGDCRFLGNVTWDGFRWFLRKSEGLGPEQSVIVESGYWEVGVIATRLQSASRLLVDIKFAQYPIAG